MQNTKACIFLSHHHSGHLQAQVLAAVAQQLSEMLKDPGFSQTFEKSRFFFTKLSNVFASFLQLRQIGKTRMSPSSSLVLANSEIILIVNN
jgi:hypothetical protein